MIWLSTAFADDLMFTPTGSFLPPADVQGRVWAKGLRSPLDGADPHVAVAVEDGTITHIGPSGVSLVTPAGLRHRYRQLSNVTVKQGDVVTRGQPIGTLPGAVGEPIELPYDLFANLDGAGPTLVPSYTSMVQAHMAPTCAAIPPSGRVIDDNDGCARLYGDPAGWRAAAEGEGGSLRWTNTWTGDTPSSYGTWTLTFQTAGTYRIEARTSAAFGRSARAAYRVEHARGADDLLVDQAHASGWAPLGEYPFDAGRAYTVTLSDNTGEPRLPLTFDALRIAPPPVAAAAPAPGPAACGVTTPTGLLWLAPLLLLRPRSAAAR